MRKNSRIPFLLLTLGLLASLWTAARRIMVERAARTVELTVDLEQLKTMSLGTGVSLREALQALKQAGVTSVAVEEKSLRQLVEDNLVQAVPGRLPGITELRIADPALYGQVVDAVRLKLRSARDIISPHHPVPPSPRLVRILGPDGSGVTIPAGWSAVELVTVGLSARDVALANAAGLGIVGRISNFNTADDAAIAEVARRLREAGAHTVIFLGEEILGHRSRIKQTAAALDAEGLRYGSVEFGKQMGDDELSRALQSRIIRVHAIQGAEMDKMAPEAVVDRFVKAAEERNIRLLYLRIFPYVSDRPFQDNVDYIAAVARGLHQRGLQLGIAEPLERVYSQTHASLSALVAPPTAEAGRGTLAARLVSRLMPAVSSFAVPAAAVLLLAGLLWMPAGTQALLALLGAGAAGLLVLGGGDLGRELLALAGAMLFPVLAFVWFPVAADSMPVEEDHSSWIPRPSSLPPYAQFAAISAVSLMGALTVVGLLSEREFMVKVAQFVGIKAAVSLPLLALVCLYAAGAFQGPWRWPALRERARRNLSRVLGLRLEVWHVLVGLAALVVIGILLARTGNDPGVGVSGTELSLRNLLDRYLVRPRTKEFLIGHPVLIATLLLSARRPGRAIFIPFAIIGAIGQVSMVNSFCHLHTPLLMTVVRTLNGLWLGVLFGTVAAWLIGRWLPAPAAAASPIREPLPSPSAPASRAGSRR